MRYVKDNFLVGLGRSSFEAVRFSSIDWRENVANVRIHSMTKRRPSELFEEERPLLRPPNPTPYDCGVFRKARVSSQCLVSFEGNRYSVPWRFAQRRISVKSYVDSLSFHDDDGKLMARHIRSYDKNLEIRDESHFKELVSQRKAADEQILFRRFENLSPKAVEFYKALALRGPGAMIHVRGILALIEIYGEAAVARAMENSLELGHADSIFVKSILQYQSSARPFDAPHPLHVPRKSDVLSIRFEKVDMGVYDSLVRHEPGKPAGAKPSGGQADMDMNGKR